eukprot:6014104-Amphidinium_carterae.1
MSTYSFRAVRSLSCPVGSSWAARREAAPARVELQHTEAPKAKPWIPSEQESVRNHSCRHAFMLQIFPF